MTEPVPTPRSGLTRRAVVRTAGHAAWAAPVIVAATAAPAFAASGPASISTTTGGVTSGTNPLAAQTLTVTTTLTNANTGDAGATTLAVAVTPTTLVGGTVNAGAPNITSADGWTFETQSGTNAGRVYNFSRTNVPGASTPTGTAATTLVFTVPVSFGGSGAITATPSVTQGAATAGMGTY